MQSLAAGKADSGRTRARFQLMALLVLEATAVVGVIAAGRIEEFALPRHDLADWLSHTSAETAFAVAGRLVAAVLTTWLVAGTVLCLAASWSRRCRRACRFSPALTRRLVESAMAITLTTSSTIVMSAPAHAAQAPPTLSMPTPTPTTAPALSTSRAAPVATLPVAAPIRTGRAPARALTAAQTPPPARTPSPVTEGSTAPRPTPPASDPTIRRLPQVAAAAGSTAPAPTPPASATKGSVAPNSVPPESVAPTTMSPWFDEGAPRTPRSGQQRNPRPGDAKGSRQQEPVPASSPTPPALANSGRTHTVAPGESLWTISGAELSRRSLQHPSNSAIASYWSAVVAANRDTLRSGNPSVIYPGEIIALPPQP